MKLRRLVVLATLAISLWQGTAASAQPNVDELRYHVRIQTSNPAATGERLQTAGFDVINVNPAGRSLDLVVTSAERDALTRAGYRVTTIDRVRPLRDALAAGTAAAPVTAAAPIRRGLIHDARSRRAGG